jgi:hypothetical protein
VTEPLKLRALDAEDLGVFSACLQDAILPLSDMAYLRDQKRFVMMANRFVWEGLKQEAAQAPDVDGEASRERVLGLLTVERVTGVRVTGLDQRDRSRILSLLAIRSGEGRIDLLFAGGGVIRLDVERIRARLDDKGEPWPTAWQPYHPLDDGDDEQETGS